MKKYNIFDENNQVVISTNSIDAFNVEISKRKALNKHSFRYIHGESDINDILDLFQKAYFRGGKVELYNLANQLEIKDWKMCGICLDETPRLDDNCLNCNE